MKSFLRNLTGYLIFLAILARAVGWADTQGPLQTRLWILLGIYGVFLFSETRLSRQLSWYPRVYIVLQAGLVIALLYMNPRLDFLPLLFYSLSFQAVMYYGDRIGFACIAVFTLAMAGMFLFGMEWGPGILMILLSGAANVLMGSYAHFITRKETARQENQRFFSELQSAFRQLKNQAVQQEELAAAQERHRLVRELHDSLTQTLFSMNLAIQAALLLSQKDPRQADEHLGRLQTLARTASLEIKGFLSQASFGPSLSKGLTDAVRALADECYRRDFLQVFLEVVGKRRFPQAVEANLFRIVQEGLNNIVHHAGVKQAWLSLCLEEPRAHLEIHDQGCGFIVAQASQTRGFGLTGMAERAEEIGWKLDVKSLPGEGTTLSVWERST